MKQEIKHQETKHQETKYVRCPQCDTEINVNDILYHQLQEEAQKEFDKKYSEVKNEKKEVEKMKLQLQESIEKGVTTKLASEKSKLEKRIRDQVTEEKSGELNSIQEQLQEKIKESKDHNKLKADYSKLKRESQEQKEKIEAEAEEKLTQKLEEEKRKIRKDIEDKTQLKISEKEHVIDQLKEQLKDAQKKAEQISMQTQGEVQELAIEEFLRTNFPLDSIQEIKKGVRGGDSLQIVNTRTKQNCGSIYYESKRAKDFQAVWVDKFKMDMREKAATFGVMVVDSYPKEVQRVSQMQGIWICSFEEFKGLCYVLRESVILLDNAVVAQEGKGGKMELLYSFLTGQEFRMQVEAIVEGFSQMQTDMTKEKRAMESIWKQREKQIQKVLVNTTNMYGSIKGIAGSAIGNIKALELSPDDSD